MSQGSIKKSGGVGIFWQEVRATFASRRYLGLIWLGLFGHALLFLREMTLSRAAPFVAAVIFEQAFLLVLVITPLLTLVTLVNGAKNDTQADEKLLRALELSSLRLFGEKLLLLLPLLVGIVLIALVLRLFLQIELGSIVSGGIGLLLVAMGMMSTTILLRSLVGDDWLVVAMSIVLCWSLGSDFITGPHFLYFFGVMPYEMSVGLISLTCAQLLLTEVIKAFGFCRG